MTHPIVPILDALRAFVDSRPGFDPRDYYHSGASGYRADARRAQRDRQDAHALLGAVCRAMTGTDDNGRDKLLFCLREALRGRLELHDDGSIRYHAGQYYCIEYRAAACRALADTLWTYWWIPGADARATARNVLGTRLARRWFT